MQKGQTPHAVGVQYTVGAQYVVGTQYAVCVSAKRSNPPRSGCAVHSRHAVGVSAKRSNMGEGDP